MYLFLSVQLVIENKINNSQIKKPHLKMIPIKENKLLT